MQSDARAGKAAVPVGDVILFSIRTAALGEGSVSLCFGAAVAWPSASIGYWGL